MRSLSDKDSVFRKFYFNFGFLTTETYLRDIPFKEETIAIWSDNVYEFQRDQNQIQSEVNDWSQLRFET